VRTTLGAPTTTAQLATQQFVTSAVAAKADDSSVVHLTGSETITGSKQFSVAPILPNPVQAGDAANKQYVDQSVQNVGSGNFLNLSGGTMTGALTLSGEPGRMTLVENRVTALERSDVRHGLYERILNAMIATGISAAIAWHDHLRIK
jgi:hypothetical protein